jgi:hypothetical protein
MRRPRRSQRPDPGRQHQQPVFALNPTPCSGQDNFQPRVGFNWQPGARPERDHRATLRLLPLIAATQGNRRGMFSAMTRKANSCVRT